ncbi:MAG: KpsF/GutQ family sugar-phosphate isomerase [Elusimicrobiota bacterium]|jgi:arabinose-5-phosphate isomerase|nr:KpsF/GutQ family sugar-phosphate isomerase [Elusimicrobiota bacterium]
MNKIAKETILIEAQAVKNQIDHIDKNFNAAALTLKNCKGHVIIMGLGKSGLVGKKISATMSSIGIPSIFIHPSESLHGDLGMIMKGDIVIMISYSGETEEIKKILPILKTMKIKIIVMTGKVNAEVWKGLDCIINCSVKKEACPYNLAPTASTTALIAMGDALALTVSHMKGFKKDDLALLHPLGAIGKKLTMHVRDIMRKGNYNPVVKENATVKDALLVMTGTRLGATSVIDKKEKIVGFFTDGDLRRQLQIKGERVLKESIKNVMTKFPRTIDPDLLAIDAVKILKQYNIDNIPVVDKNGKPIGCLEQGDLLAEGISE